MTTLTNAMKTPPAIGGTTPGAGTFTTVSAETAEGSAFEITTGTISYATNWTAGSASTVKKKGNLVVLNFSCTGSGSGSATVATLPSGYRPITASMICAGNLFYADGPSYSVIRMTIATSGTITMNFVVPSTASGDIVSLNVSYFVA